jgi:hypothetical protein
MLTRIVSKSGVRRSICRGSSAHGKLSYASEGFTTNIHYQCCIVGIATLPNPRSASTQACSICLRAVAWSRPASPEMVNFYRGSPKDIALPSQVSESVTILLPSSHPSSHLIPCPILSDAFPSHLLSHLSSKDFSCSHSQYLHSRMQNSA